MIYDKVRYRPGHAIKGIKPAVIAEQLDILKAEGNGVVTPAAVVEHARPANSPLHSAFDWKDRDAAVKWREHQARRLISSIEIIQADEPEDDGPQTQVAYLSVANHRGEAGYMSTDQAMSDETIAEKVLRDALSQLRAWKRRYGKLRALRPVIEAIEEMEGAAV